MAAEDAVRPVLYRSCRHPRFSCCPGGGRLVHESWEAEGDPGAVLASGRAARDDIIE